MKWDLERGRPGGFLKKKRALICGNNYYYEKDKDVRFSDAALTKISKVLPRYPVTVFGLYFEIFRGAVGKNAEFKLIFYIFKKS